MGLLGLAVAFGIFKFLPILAAVSRTPIDIRIGKLHRPFPLAAPFLSGARFDGCRCGWRYLLCRGNERHPETTKHRPAFKQNSAGGLGRTTAVLYSLAGSLKSLESVASPSGS
jgi:hypothetical protein